MWTCGAHISELSAVPVHIAVWTCGAHIHELSAVPVYIAVWTCEAHIHELSAVPVPEGDLRGPVPVPGGCRVDLFLPV